ncbi:hypothetical protein ACX80E_14220 [Arthrobacter sp. TMN-49]
MSVGTAVIAPHYDIFAAASNSPESLIFKADSSRWTEEIFTD